MAPLGIMPSGKTRSFADLGRGDSLRSVIWNRPPWADALLARRLLAAALTALAIVLLLRGDPGSARTEIVVAGRDLPPGHLLEATDLRAIRLESGTLPAGAVDDIAVLVGATLTGAMRAGEVFTDLRVVGPRLAAVATGTGDARIVPIRLADTAVAEILRAGDRRGAPERVVLVAMDAEHATAVAAASLRTALTVVFH